MDCKANGNSPELNLRKTAIAREVTLDSQEAVKFLSIWFNQIKILTTIDKKNGEKKTTLKLQFRLKNYNSATTKA